MDDSRLSRIVGVASLAAGGVMLAAGIAAAIWWVPPDLAVGRKILAAALLVAPPVVLTVSGVLLLLGMDVGRKVGIGYALLGLVGHFSGLAACYVAYVQPAVLAGKAAVAVPLFVLALLLTLGYDIFLLATQLRTKISVIARRELASVFASPLAYLAGAGFLLLVGVLFAGDFEPGLEASLRQLFSNIVMVLVLAVPLLTMPLLSEEYSRGTIETMMTAPVSEIDLTLGKFFGVFGFYLALLAATLPHYVLLSVYGQPEAGQAIIAYFGMLLVGGAFIAIGLFFSSLTRHQLLAALLTAMVLATLTLLPVLLRQMSGFWVNIVKYASVPGNFDNFSKGIVDTRSMVFFLSLTVFFLFVSVKVVESRRWR